MSYNPSVGRWMQEDPDGYIDGPNMFQFEDSSPVMKLDPSGDDPSDIPAYDWWLAKLTDLQQRQAYDLSQHGGNQGPDGPWLAAQVLKVSALIAYWELKDIHSQARYWAKHVNPGYNLFHVDSNPNGGQCYSQAKSCAKWFVQNHSSYKFWYFDVTGGSSGLANHNVLWIRPQNNNPFPDYIDDVWAAPFQWGGLDPILEPLSQFKLDWPNPVRQ